MVRRLSNPLLSHSHRPFTVTLGGAVLFILFALIYFHEAFTYVDPNLSPDPTLHSLNA